MIFTIYDPPDSSNSKTWGELCVGAIVDVSSWEYEGQFCGVGTFELVVPVGAEGVDKLKLDRFLMCGDGGFIIKQLEFGAEEVQVSGYDLNGLLLGRLTVAKTEDGKDKQSGSTEAIVKHYVAANCVSSADEGRNFPGFVVAANQNRGIANDAASPRLQVVGDVISDILSAQKMGWRITAVGMEAGYTGGEKFSFDIISAIDRTWNQTANDSVSFSYGLGTVNSMKSEQSSADARNTLYCELSDGTVQTYSPTDGNSGYARTEDFAALNCDLSELSIYADHEIADRFAAINNVTIEHIDPSQWGTKIHLGDIVTVYDKHIGLNSNEHTLEALITAVKVKRANGESEISITIGGTRPKLIDRVSKDVGVVSKNVGDVSSKTKETTAQLQERVTVIEKGSGPKDRIVSPKYGRALIVNEPYSATHAVSSLLIRDQAGKLRMSVAELNNGSNEEPNFYCNTTLSNTSNGRNAYIDFSSQNSREYEGIKVRWFDGDNQSITICSGNSSDGCSIEFRRERKNQSTSSTAQDIFKLSIGEDAGVPYLKLITNTSSGNHTYKVTLEKLS